MFKMQGRDSMSFSIVDDDDFNFDEAIPVENAKDIPSPKKGSKDTRSAFTRPKNDFIRALGSDSDEDDLHFNLPDQQSRKNSLGHVTALLSSQTRIPSAGPSGRQTVAKIRSPIFDHGQRPSSESDTDDSERKKLKGPLPGEYDPTIFEDLDVSEEIKEVFQYITKYIPQNLNLDYKFKPFIPDFIPAVGDIDAFLKVIPPEIGINGQPYKNDQSHLGLTVLDEPAAIQSDPALLHLQLRAASVNVSQSTNMIVKKVANVDKNAKVIDKWIKDISDLHKTKSSPVVKYSEPMPDLDDLMQEWPEPIENLLKLQGFPSYKMKGPLTEYIDLVCCIFDIPVHKNRIQSLHLLFSLYAAVKNSQLYRNANTGRESSNEAKGNGTDRLLLD